ncbi:MAG: MFS transporter [Dehalococcoidia bacterium]|nr:MFS transporter [Dehalococcoidia bacterium]
MTSPDSAPAEEGAVAMPAWAPFRFADYRLFWLGSVAATITQQLAILATGVWLFERTGSAAQLGLLGGVQLIVQIPALLYGGTLADELDRKRLMALTQAISAATLAALAVLAVGGTLAPWHIYAATAVTSVTGVLGQPARAALTASVVPRTHLMHAITANTITLQVGSIVAPLLFAAVAERWGLTPAFVVTAATAAPSAILPLLIRAGGRPVGVTPTDTMARRVWEGFQYVRRHRVLPGLLLLDAGMTVFTFYRQVLPALASGLFRGGPGAVGLLTSANSGGAVLGSLAVFFTPRYRAKGMLVVYATVAFSVLVFLFGTTTSLWAGALIITGMGATDALSMTMRQAVMQLTTPDQMLGRTLSLGTLGATTANNVGTLWVGLLAAAIGEASTMRLGGALALLCTLVVWRAVRGLRDYRYP